MKNFALLILCFFAITGCNHGVNPQPINVNPQPISVNPQPINVNPAVESVVNTAVLPSPETPGGLVLVSPEQVPDDAILSEIQHAMDKGEQVSANRMIIFADNYPGTSMQLRGCVNDGRDIACELVRRGALKSTEIKFYKDHQCTAAAMRAGLKWVTADAKPGDLRVIFYSGHGAQTAEGAAGEKDKLVEVWCPYDFDWTPEKYISDKEIYALLKAVPAGVRVVVLSDSCHAGGMDRLEITKSKRPKTIIPPDAILARSRKAERAAGNGVLDVQFGLACRENELSADTQDAAGRPCGAFTHYFLISLRAKPALTFKQLIQSTGSRMKADGYGDQVPQAEGLGIDREFLR